MIKAKINLSDINKVFQNISKHKVAKRNKKILNYLRIYSHLLTARAFLKSKVSRFKTHAIIAKKLTRGTEFEDERVYIERINKILSSVLSVKRSDEAAISAIETKLLLAQNICILRVLKTAL